MKYNYVVLGAATDFMITSYADIAKADYAIYQYKLLATQNPLLNVLYRYHTSPILNRKVPMPFRGIWNPLIFKNSFADDKPICFILFGNKRLFASTFINYIRKTYRGSKIVFFAQDLIARSWGEKFSEIKGFFDLIISFDHADAKTHGVDYYPLVYSPYDIPEDDSIPESDVYFVGKAKDRLPQILAAYEKLRNSGLKCDFYITGVKPEDQKYADEITYGNQMPYIENLKHIKKTKCLLEIMQGGGHGYTLRACEAIMYDKKMITDNPEISGAPFYQPELISVFNCAEDIDPSFVIAEPAVVDYKWKANLSPLKLLEYIDEKFEREQGAFGRS